MPHIGSNINNIYITGSNINEVIRAVLNFFFFFTKKFHTHKKHQKAHRAQRVLKAPKSQKAQKITKKHKNATKQKHKTQISEQK